MTNIRTADDAVSFGNAGAVIIGGLILLVVIITALLFTVPFWVQNSNPIIINSENSADFIESQPYNNVIVQAVTVYDSGYEEYVENIGGRASTTLAYFPVIDVGNALIVARVTGPIDPNRNEYSGSLVRPNGVSGEAFETIFAEIVDFLPEARNFIVPMLLETEVSSTGWVIATIIQVIGLLIGLALVIYSIMRRATKGNHPIYRNLSRLGNLDAVQQRVTDELAAGSTTVGRLQLTRDLVLENHDDIYEVILYADIVWLHGFVRSEKDKKVYEARIADVHGHMVRVAADDEAMMNDMLNAIAPHTPWVAKGHSAELQYAWDTEQERFIAEIRRRRDAMPAADIQNDDTEADPLL